MKKLILIFILLLVVITGCTTDKKALETNTQNNENKVVVNEESATTSENSNAKIKKEEITDIEANTEYSNDYIFPNSDKVKLTFDDIYNIDFENCDLARNEIYARRGFVFKSERYLDYFSKKSWYSPREDFKASEFNPIESYNIKLLAYFEKLDKMYDEVGEESKTTESGGIQGIEIYDRNKEIYVDINGDGEDEKILFKTNGEEDSHYGNIGSLFINDQEVKLDGCMISNSFAIVDIDQRDNIKEIIISDEGPSSDFISQFFYYNGKKIIEMGTVGGLYDFGITMDCVGEISAMSRADILHTWFFDRMYRLDSNHKIIEIEQDVFETNFFVFVKEPLRLYTTRDINGDSFVVKEGTVINLAGTDNKEWCLAKTKDGKKGWFALDNFDNVKGTNLNARDFFIGLCYAD